MRRMIYKVHIVSHHAGSRRQSTSEPEQPNGAAVAAAVGSMEMDENSMQVHGQRLAIGSRRASAADETASVGAR